MSGVMWWQALVVDIVGTVVTVTLGAAIAWLGHRRGWWAQPLNLLAGLLGKNRGVIEKDVEALIIRAVDEALTRQAVGAASAKPPAPGG